MGTRKEKCCRMFATMMALLTWFSLGVMQSVPGPTLLQITQIANASIDKVTYIFGARGIGELVGILFSGFVMRDRYRSAMFGVTLTSSGIAMLLVPWSSGLPRILIAFALNGFGIGYLISGTIRFLKNLWKNRSAVTISLATSFFLLGGTLIPLIASPFLPHDSGHNVNETWRNCSIFMMNETVADGNKSCIHVADGVGSKASHPNVNLRQMKMLYGLVMGINCSIALGLAVSSYLVENEGLADAISDESGGKHFILHGNRRRFVICIAALCMICFSGSESNTMGLVASYVVKGVGDTERNGAFVTSTFWALCTVSATLQSIAFYYLTPSTIFLLDYILMTIAGLILVFGAANMTIVWIGTVVQALGTSYATVLIWADGFVGLTPKVSSLLLIFGRIGTFTLPVITGPLFKISPRSLMIVNLIAFLLSDALFIIVESIAFPYVRRERTISLGLLRTKSLELPV